MRVAKAMRVCEADGSIKPGAQAPGSPDTPTARPRETADSASMLWLSAASRAPMLLINLDPGACAPGFMLSPAIAGFLITPRLQKAATLGIQIDQTSSELSVLN